MEIIIAKPAIPAFENDINSGLDCLNKVIRENGLQRGQKLNSGLYIDFGLELIFRNKDMSAEQLETIRQRISGITMPVTFHAPYDYDLTTSASRDLTLKGKSCEDLEKLAVLAEQVGADSIAVHPNALRTGEVVSSQEYNESVQDNWFGQMVQNIFDIQSRHPRVSIDLETKPIPYEDYRDNSAFFSVMFAPFRHLEEYAQQGGKITFDTCHYGITRRTFNDITHQLNGKVTRKDLLELNYPEYFPRDMTEQPSVSDAILRLGASVNHLHLNDGSVYSPYPNTGGRNFEKGKKYIEGRLAWCHGYVQGKGSLCRSDCVAPWLAKHQGEDRRVFLTLEVEEFDKDYKNAPRFFESAIDVCRTLKGI